MITHHQLGDSSHVMEKKDRGVLNSTNEAVRVFAEYTNKANPRAREQAAL